MVEYYRLSTIDYLLNPKDFLVFRSAALRLTLWYLAIIMALSIGFSFAIYRLSSNELARSANRPSDIYNLLFGANNPAINELRIRQLDKDRNHLRSNLFIFNFVVLVIGGGVSYWLARRTLGPIEEAHDMQKRFTGDASHELRTPLATMQTEIEVALRSRQLTKEEAVKLLKSNLEEVNRLKALSEGLLALATTADRETPFENVSLKIVAVDTIEQISKRAKAKGVKIKNSIKDMKVNGNYQQILNLLSILLDNAIKYSPRGSEVLLSARKKDKHAEITVSDNGFGIAPEHLPRIFERFYRADSSRTKNDAHGYGLGLAIAKKVIDLHKGRIEVRSEVGKGSTFIVHLPLSPRSGLGKRNS